MAEARQYRQWIAMAQVYRAALSKSRLTREWDVELLPGQRVRWPLLARHVPSFGVKARVRFSIDFGLYH